MMFRRAIFGFAPKDVSTRFSEMEAQLAQKDGLIKDLKRSLQKLEYSNEELAMRLQISEELRTGRNSQQPVLVQSEDLTIS